MEAFKQLNFQNKDLQLLQDNVASVVKSIQTSPLLGGQLLSNVALVSGQDNLINHSLGYTPTIILPLVPNANATIWSPTSTSLSGSNASKTQVNLRCSSNCTVSVVVI